MKNIVEEMESVLRECLDYFDERADADYLGEESGFVANEEMKLQMEIEDVLTRLRKGTKNDTKT